MRSLLLGLALWGAPLVAQESDLDAAQESRQEIPGRPVDSSAVAAPVIVRGDTVLLITAASGAFTAAERADAIEARMLRLTRERLDSLTLAVGEQSTDILAGDLVLMSVTEQDAAAAGRSRAQLAQAYRVALFDELGRVSIQATLKAIAFGLLWTLIATAVLVVLLRLLRRGTERLETMVESRRDGRIPGVRIRTIELVSAQNVANVLTGTVRGLRVVGIITLLYFYLPLVLSFFPWTQRYSDRLVGYVLDPLGRVLGAIANYLPNLLFIAIIVFVARYALKVVRLVFNALGSGTLHLGGFEREWADPTYKIVRFLIIAFVGVVMFPYLPGADSDAFKGVSLFLGVLVSFGSSSAIANIVAGTVLTYTRAFNVGDRVRIGETTGDVIAKSLLVTRVRTIKNVDVTIPNAMVLSTHVLNFTALASGPGIILHTGVTIGYDVPWRQVHQLLTDAAKATKDVQAEPAPFVVQTSLDDFYVSYELNAYTANAKAMARVYGELHANIQDAFNAAGVEIMSPHYKALRDGNVVTIPAEHLAKDYVPPSFRVESTRNSP
ncbi:MAG: mechanosensitive ion channel family protein [Gemmatimonadaceae bacterium]|nr:mechanosensitive ion channel family protein [Gemmatimonadaceae bacterium]